MLFVINSRAGERHIIIPIGLGIIGNVAKTKIGRNIRDAYTEPLFNPSIDQATGFKTKNLLVLPIFSSIERSSSTASNSGISESIEDMELLGVLISERRFNS